jgi:hypothetical protein
VNPLFFLIGVFLVAFPQVFAYLVAFLLLRFLWLAAWR